MDCPRLGNIYVFPVEGDQKVEMIDYNLVMWIGLGLIVGGFCLFLYSEMRLRQLDREQWKLNQSFNKAKKDNQFEINADGTETKKDSIL